MTAVIAGAVAVLLSVAVAGVYVFAVNVGRREGRHARQVKLSIVTYNGAGERTVFGPVSLDELGRAVAYCGAPRSGRVPLYGAPLRAATGDLALAVLAERGPDIASRDRVNLGELYDRPPASSNGEAG